MLVEGTIKALARLRYLSRARAAAFSLSLSFYNNSPSGKVQ